MFSAQQYSGFDPRTIPGCALWLDAADGNSFTPANPTGGTAISQWNDKSGNSRHATQSTVGNRPVYSSSDISVDTTTNPQFFNMTSMPAAPYDIFVVARPRSTTTGWRTLFRTNTTDPGMNPVALEDGTTRVGYFTSSTFAQFGSYTWAASTRNLLFARMNATKTMNASLNGAISLTADTVAGTASDVILYMGALVVSGSVLQQWGNINEVIFYTTPLTTAQRQQVEGYLAWKWGLQANLPTGHPFRPNPAAMRVFQPNDIAGLQLWFDGLDPNGNGTVPANNAALSTWVDKSGAGNSGTASGTTPLYQSGSGVLFSTGAYLTNYSASLSDESLFFVYTPTTSTASIVLAGPSANGGRTLINNINLRLESSSYFVAFGSLTPDGTVPLNQRCQSAYVITSGSSVVVHNGVTYSPVSLSFTGGLTTRIGAAGSTLTQFFKGTIHEVIAYNVALTTSQRQQIEGYLAAKWGLSASLPTTQPFYLQRALPSTPLFVPSTLSNLGLWLDGADSSTITGTTTVTAWNDKSGNGRNATTTSNHPSYTSGTNYIQFSGSNWLNVNLSFLANTQYTLFFTVKRESSKAENFFMSSTETTTNANLHIGFSPDTATIKYAQWANQVTPNPTITAYTGNNATEPNNLYSFQQTASQRIVYVNGSNISATTNTSLVSAQNDGLLGVYFRSPTTSFQGRFYEVVMFPRALATSERQQVEGYLAWKYNFQQNLATTHPYYKFRP